MNRLHERTVEALMEDPEFNDELLLKVEQYLKEDLSKEDLISFIDTKYYFTSRELASE